MQMNLTELRDLVNNIDTFGINPDHVKVHLMVNDHEVGLAGIPKVAIRVADKVKSQLVINLVPTSVGE